MGVGYGHNTLPSTATVEKPAIGTKACVARPGIGWVRRAKMFKIRSKSRLLVFRRRVNVTEAPTGAVIAFVFPACRIKHGALLLEYTASWIHFVPPTLVDHGLLKKVTLATSNGSSTRYCGTDLFGHAGEKIFCFSPRQPLLVSSAPPATPSSPGAKSME